MSHPPSTPVKVPGSAATYTPATLDPELRSQINSALLRDGHIAKYVMSELYCSSTLLSLEQTTNELDIKPPSNQPGFRINYFTA